MADTNPAQVGDFISDNPVYADALAAAQESLYVAMDMATAGTADDLRCEDVVAHFGASACLYDMRGEIEHVLAACAGEDKPAFWQLAYPFLAVEADRRYDRRDLLEQAWPQIRAIADGLIGTDYAALAESLAGEGEDRAFRGWATIYAALSLCDLAAQRLGEPTVDIDRAIEGLYLRIHERFAHEDGSFGEGAQTSYALAARLGLGDSHELAARLAELVRADGGTDDETGAALAFDVLNRFGYDEVAEAWFAAGAGSSAVPWLFQALGGMRLADDAVAANRIEARPYFSTKTDNVTCSYKTPRGQLFLTWERREHDIALTLMVPAGTEVDLWLQGALQVIPADPDPLTQAFRIEL